MVALSLPLIPSNLVRGPQRRWGESEKLGECFYTVCEYEGVNLGLEERKKELSCLLPQGMSGRDPGQKELSGMQRCARAPSHTLTRGRAWASLVSTFSWLAYSVHLPRLAVVKKKNPTHHEDCDTGCSWLHLLLLTRTASNYLWTRNHWENPRTESEAETPSVPQRPR